MRLYSIIEHDIETRLTSIDFSRQGTKGFRRSWLQTLGNQLIDRSPYVRYTNCKCYLLYYFNLNYQWVSSECAHSIVCFTVWRKASANFLHTVCYQGWWVPPILYDEGCMSFHEIHALVCHWVSCMYWNWLPIFHVHSCIPWGLDTNSNMPTPSYSIGDTHQRLIVIGAINII